MSWKSFKNKAKGFFSRVWNGIKSGYGKVKEFIRNKVAPIYEKIKPYVNLVPGGGVITGVVDKILPKVNQISDDPNTALKQGVKMAADKLGEKLGNN